MKPLHKTDYWHRLVVGSALVAMTCGCQTTQKSTVPLSVSPPPVSMIRKHQDHVEKQVEKTEESRVETEEPNSSPLHRVNYEVVEPTPATAVDNSVKSEDLNESTAAGEASEAMEGMTIDLASALSRAGIANPTIALARERVSQALAQQQAANVLLLPNLTAGMNYHLHVGNLQASPGFIRDVNSQSVYVGAGARSLAAESVAFPGVRLFAHLGDALMEPEAAQYNTNARNADSLAVQNETLFEVSEAYLELVGADATVEELRRGEEQLGEIARLTDAYAKTGQGRLSDAGRAETRLTLIKRQRQDAEGERAATAARLASLLSIDPTANLSPIPGPMAPVMLVDDNSDLSSLIYQAMGNRPDRTAGFAELSEAQTRYRQEQLRPWVPTISAGFSGAGFGGGSNLVPYNFGSFSGRTDFDVMAVWTVQNFGVGNWALQKQTAARVDQAGTRLVSLESEIRAEVSEALAEVQSARIQVSAAEQAVIAAREGAAEELNRIKSDVARPIEVLDSFEQLIESRVAYVETVTAYNIAQFRLWVAVGGTPMASMEHLPATN